MKVYLGFLLVCFFAGWLLNKFSLKVMTLLLIGFSLMIMFGYYFMDLI